MTNTDVVKRLYELFETGNNNAIRQILDDNVEWNQMKGFPSGGQFVGIEAVLDNVFGGFRQNWTDWKATITQYIETEDGAFVIGFYSGTYNATGLSTRSEFVSDYRVKNGRITAFNQYTDTFLIARAMGLTREYVENLATTSAEL